MKHPWAPMILIVLLGFLAGSSTEACFVNKMRREYCHAKYNTTEYRVEQRAFLVCQSIERKDLP